ncbi:hypothetical protein [Winogradskyella sp. SYSU M77433]|uniref:hypothetical protein n=1 Tax=Winogradskyella sp. SYSU M77433 TaxID=3042722 RepID=UPI0024812BB5|nr:hypothetical protein [Winogradskyella sp. SYSU M77433]MDH7912682.1 hypothetical protein [Winogradskyella sp. SYSU M77433]
MNNEAIILKEEKILDFIWFFILLIVFGIISIPFEGLFEKEVHNKAFDFIMAFLFFSILYMTRITFIEGGYIVKGIKLSSFILNKQKILIAEIKDVIITQDLENYYVISAIHYNNTSFEIKKIPNKNPALKELDLIRTYLNLNSHKN